LDIIAEWFKQWFIPGSFSFFYLGALVGLVLLYMDERRARWGKRWLTALIVIYLLMAMPIFASGMENLLQGDLGTRFSDQQVVEIDAIVVLGGGGASYIAGERELSVLSESSALRLIEGLRLWELLDPDWLVVSGGDNPRAGLLTAESETMRDTLVDLGVPEDRILLESGSANTHDQALNLRELFEESGINRFILVTSPTHMRRAYLTFLHAGYDPIPASALEHSQSRDTFGNLIVPSINALNSSRNVMRELFGLLYYVLRGWI
jgi:uncharacterized SAM-binding protein YcdF (DUF218 family)